MYAIPGTGSNSSILDLPTFLWNENVILGHFNWDCAAHSYLDAALQWLNIATLASIAQS